MGIIVLGFDFAPTTGIGKPCVGRKIAAFPVLRRGGPMWASAPTNDHGKSTNLKGGQSRPPLQVTVKNNDSISSAPTTGIGKPCVGRKTATFPVLRRRGRCPHRPAGERPFYGGFPANACWFSFLRRRGGRPCPPAGKCPFSRRSDANSQHFGGPMWASAPTNGRRKSPGFEGGQSRPPLQGV